MQTVFDRARWGGTDKEMRALNSIKVTCFGHCLCVYTQVKKFLPVPEKCFCQKYTKQKEEEEKKAKVKKEFVFQLLLI